MLNLGMKGNRMKPVKILTILTLTVIFGLIVTGCEDALSAGSEINAPIVINYTVNNPLEVLEHKEGNGNESNYVYLTVEGLKDKEIEQNINDRIKAVYEELRIQDIPPYRGMKAQISDDWKITSEQIYMNATANFNHILSITANKYAVYQDLGTEVYSEKDPNYYESSRYVSETETLNFDLNTGEEIKLKDLFCDDADYMELLNDSMNRFLSSNHADEEGYYPGRYSDIKLVESFKGLSEDQKFSVSSYGISFVFDYSTPQFDTHGMAISPRIPFTEFGENLAITKRYFNEEENIFTSAVPLSKSLVNKGDPHDVSGNEYFKDSFINIYISWSYASSLPEKIKGMLDSMVVTDEEAIAEMNRVYREMPREEINEKGEGSYEVMVFGDQIGDYINVTKHINQFFPDHAEQKIEYHCFDLAGQKELALKDLFVKDYEHKPVVLKAIREAFAGYDGNDQGTAASSKYSDEFLEKIYGQIVGFNLSADEIYIPFIYPEEGGGSFGLLAIPYKNFGCENMTIFHDRS